MSKNVAAAVAAVLVGAAQAENFTGQGATFPAPVYSAWAQSYRSAAGDELEFTRPSVRAVVSARSRRRRSISALPTSR